MGKHLKTVGANYLFLGFRLVITVLCLGYFAFNFLFNLRDMPKEISISNLCILFILIGVPTIGLLTSLVINVLRLRGRLEFYENGIKVNGKSYVWGELEEIRFMKTNYLFLGVIQTPISYFYMSTNTDKFDFSDLYYWKAHLEFITTYKTNQKERNMRDERIYNEFGCCSTSRSNLHRN